MALSGATIPDHRGSEGNSNEGVLCIPQSSSITGTKEDLTLSYKQWLVCNKTKPKQIKLSLSESN